VKKPVRKRKGYAEGGPVGQTEAARDKALRAYGQTLSSRRQLGTDVDQKADAYRQGQKFWVQHEPPAKKTLLERIPQGDETVDRDMNRGVNVPRPFLRDRGEIDHIPDKPSIRSNEPRYNATEKDYSIAMAKGGKVKKTMPIKRKR
jgi:hypothetical protein